MKEPVAELDRLLSSDFVSLRRVKKKSKAVTTLAVRMESDPKNSYPPRIYDRCNTLAAESAMTGDANLGSVLILDFAFKRPHMGRMPCPQSGSPKRWLGIRAD